MQKLNPKYVVGLIDGEGSFTVQVRNSSNQVIKRRARVEPRFYVKLIARDKRVLYALKNFFKCGAIYFQKDNRPNHQQCYRYEVFNREEIKQMIIPFFRKNQLQTISRKKDFQIFCVLVEMIDQKVHFTKFGLRKMLKLKEKMH